LVTRKSDQEYELMNVAVAAMCDRLHSNAIKAMAYRCCYRLGLLPLSFLSDLDSGATPPPPFTSFLGWRSRIMASLILFLSRRQTIRTTLTSGSRVFLLKQFSQFYLVKRFTEKWREEQAENCSAVADAQGSLSATLKPSGKG
jgi:hypothetical protein